MSETVIIALITAGSGFFGAVLGAVGAILGPWWVKKTEIEAERARHEKEEMRKAIVDLSIKNTSAIMEFYQVFSFGKNSSDIVHLANLSNNAVTELYSRIPKEEGELKVWMNGFLSRSRRVDVKSVEDLGVVSAFLNTGFLHLISWYVGELPVKKLKPFGLDEKGNSIWLRSWDDGWPKKSG